MMRITNVAWVLFVLSAFAYSLETEVLEANEAQTLEDDEFSQLRYQLISDNWQEALTTLTNKAQQPPSPDSCSASLVLGDFYMGLIVPESLILHPTWSPPPVDLHKAFSYYAKAVQYPIKTIGKAYYMISFLLTHHPVVAVPDEELGQNLNFGSRVTRSVPPAPVSPNPNLAEAEDGKSPLSTASPAVPPSESTPQVPPKFQILSSVPNIPLALIHQEFAARENTSEALISLGYKHLLGHYTPKSCNRAATLYDKAAHLAVELSTKTQIPGIGSQSIKLSTDSVNLEEEYDSGKSTMEEEKDIVQFYRYSADTGNVESQISMGIIYLKGDIGGIPQDYEQAFRYFTMAMDNGDVSAGTHLGHLYQNGLGTAPDNETAILFYKQAALDGDAHAQTQLGILHLNGWAGVEQDYDEAKDWFEHAAEQQDAEALLYLGRMAYNGQGMPKSHTKARTYFQQAAQGASLVAMYNLAVMNLNGIGGAAASCQNGVSLFKKIVEMSVLKKMSVLAYRLYARGFTDRALIHYEIAGDMGDSLSQVNSAWMYEKGIGVRTLYGKLQQNPKFLENINLLASSKAKAKESATTTVPHTPTPTPTETQPEPTITEPTKTATPTEPPKSLKPAPIASTHFNLPAPISDIISIFIGPPPELDSRTAARRSYFRQKSFLWYLRAAEQNSASAHLKLGDFHYYGWTSGGIANLGIAVQYYRQASDLRSAQATWNLGYMHHHGLGLPKDIHLAKRYYDLSREYDPEEAFVPSLLGLVSLAYDHYLDQFYKKTSTQPTAATTGDTTTTSTTTPSPTDKPTDKTPATDKSKVKPPRKLKPTKTKEVDQLQQDEEDTDLFYQLLSYEWDTIAIIVLSIGLLLAMLLRQIFVD